jgi:serine protease Do
MWRVGRVFTIDSFRSVTRQRAPSWCVLVLALHLGCGELFAQPRLARPEALADAHQKSGTLTLRAFASVSEAARGSVVQLARDGERAALGTVIEAEGWILSKASELTGGALTCLLPDGAEVAARVVTVDDRNDLALVRVEVDGLRPVAWAAAEAAVGQWAITPGLDSVPEAVGIVSAPPRRIQHRRALIGVELDPASSEARIRGLMPGLGAELAGLSRGDIVRAVNEVPVASREELVRLLREFREGQQVRVQVQRAEEFLEVDVTMMVPPAEIGGRPMDRAERMNRMGSELSVRADGFDEALTHDTVLHAWQCGGPLLNLSGETIGMNIARAGRVASYALPAGLARAIAEEMLAENRLR